MPRLPFPITSRAASGGAFSSRNPFSRLVPAVLTVLVHVVLAAAFMRYGGMPDRASDDGPASYVAFAFIAPSRPARTEPAMRLPSIPPSAPGQAPQRAKSAATATPMPPSTQPEAPPSGLPSSDVPPSNAPSADAPSSDPPAPAGAQQGLDLGALRAAALRIDSERPRQPGQLRATDDSKLARAVRQARRPDCQTKYSGGDKLDLILLIPLAIETITDKGCQW